MLRSFRSSSVCTSRRRWRHRSDVNTENLSPITLPETFGRALSGAGWCNQTGFVSVGISLNRPTYIIAYLLLNFISNEFIIRSNNYKLHTYIHFNYSIQVMSN